MLFRSSQPLGEDEKNMLLTMAKEQKATGPEGTGDFTEYEDLTYQGKDITAQVEEAWNFLVEHAFVM